MSISEIIAHDLSLIEVISSPKGFRAPNSHKLLTQGFFIDKEGRIYSCGRRSHQDKSFEVFGMGSYEAKRKLGVIITIRGNDYFYWDYFQIPNSKQLAAVKRIAGDRKITKTELD
jgi:hypothetical protein